MKFQDGQRVLYTSPYYHRDVPNAKQFASMGGELVMHLNAKDADGRNKPITGTISGRGQTLADGSTWYDFHPDGWICANESGWPKGFRCPEEHLSALKDDSLIQPGTITDRTGRPIGDNHAKS